MVTKAGLKKIVYTKKGMKVTMKSVPAKRRGKYRWKIVSSKKAKKKRYW